MKLFPMRPNFKVLRFMQYFIDMVYLKKNALDK